MTKGPFRYDNQLPKKLRQPKPPYWMLTNLLRKLLLKYRERETGTQLFHITVPDFGIVFKFNPIHPMLEYKGWHVIDVDMAQLQKNAISFGENLIYLLISKGYMAYLRDPVTGQRSMFDRFIGREGWGRKIIEKRLELYNNQPEHRFLIQHNIKMREKSISYILTHHPDFFDYLW